MAANDRFSVSKFKSRVDQYAGLSRGVFYDCHIFQSNLEDQGSRLNRFDQDETELLCKAANLPSLELETTEVKYFTRSIKIPSTRSFQPVTLTFYNVEDYRFYDKFVSWLNLFNNPSENIRTQFTNINSFHATIVISPRDAVGHEITAIYKFNNAFPISISGLQYSFENDTQVQTFDVQFQYLYPEFNSISPKIKGDINILEGLGFDTPTTPDPLPARFRDSWNGMGEFPPSINPRSSNEKSRRKKFLGLF